MKKVYIHYVPASTTLSIANVLSGVAASSLSGSEMGHENSPEADGFATVDAENEIGRGIRGMAGGDPDAAGGAATWSSIHDPLTIAEAFHTRGSCRQSDVCGTDAGSTCSRKNQSGRLAAGRR